MSNPSDILFATLAIYKVAINKASKSLIRNWKIIPGSIIAYLLYDISIGIFAPLGIFGRFITSVIDLYLLSLFYNWLVETKRGK